MCVSLCGPQRPDSSGKGDGTVASGEMDGLGDQCKGCEGKAGREGGKEGRGVSQHAAPLGIRAMTSKALPPSNSLQKEHVVKVERARARLSDIHHKGAPYQWQRPRGTYVGMIVPYRAPPTGSVSC